MNLSQKSSRLARIFCRGLNRFTAGKNKLNRERNPRAVQVERGQAIRVPGKIALVASLRSSGNHLRSGFERAARIFALGYRKLQLAAPAFLANEINCDADRIRNSGHGNDFHAET